jgi:cysteine desulfurase
MKEIYLDNASTTPMDERVLKAMLPYFTEKFGNASSLHSYGTEAKDSLDNSRSTIAGYIEAKPHEVYFTSSGTESNNLAIKGVAFANKHKGNHIIVSSIEHDCILHTCQWLESQGFFITYLPASENGMINPDDVNKYISNKTILVSVMHANNEIGTIQPIEEIGKICKERNVYFHTDACQSFGKIHIDVNKQNIDILTINSHKIYGPKGVGALYVNKNVNMTPLLHGGGQENSLRSSTENIPGIVGFAKAAELCFENFDSEFKRITKLRDKLIQKMEKNIENFYINGDIKNRLANNINFSIHGLEGETIRLLLLLDEKGIAVSTGSACSSNDNAGNASHVLQALGRDPFEARGAIRVSIGRFNTEEHIDKFYEILSKCIMQLNPIFGN